MNTPTIPREELKEKLEAWAKKINHLAHSTNHPDWNEKADILRACLTELEFLEWLLANCKIIHWPGGGHYPIEHAPAASKDGVWLLKMAMNKEGMYAKPLMEPAITTNQQEAE